MELMKKKEEVRWKPFLEVYKLITYDANLLPNPIPINYDNSIIENKQYSYSELKTS